jgi:hypothetical protein
MSELTPEPDLTGGENKKKTIFKPKNKYLTYEYDNSFYLIKSFDILD